MIIITEDYAIKNDNNCYIICKRKKRKGEDVFEGRWYFNTFSQALCFLVDRSVYVDGTMEDLARQIEDLKRDVKIACEQGIAMWGRS